MNLTISGRNITITPAIRSYVEGKLIRVKRHFDQVIDVNVILGTDHLIRRAEVTCRVAGRQIVVKSDNPDLYAAIDALADKLDRQIVKYKDRLHTHPHDALKYRSGEDR